MCVPTLSPTLYLTRTQRAVNLSRVLSDLAATEKFANFDSYYIDNPIGPGALGLVSAGYIFLFLYFNKNLFLQQEGGWLRRCVCSCVSPCSFKWPFADASAIVEWEARGGQAWQLIEPIDGFHPAQVCLFL
jgi:hypothetical protein